MEVYPQSVLSNTFLPMQYTDVFYRSKNRKILLKTKICFFFKVFAQNIHCGYMLEPPR